MTKTDVGVDAVLSADVGDAPMRQRQYTAPVDAPSAARRPPNRKTSREQSLEILSLQSRQAAGAGLKNRVRERPLA
jgi:hypothetical protein